jgi:hypothetical protein
MMKSVSTINCGSAVIDKAQFLLSLLRSVSLFASANWLETCDRRPSSDVSDRCGFLNSDDNNNLRAATANCLNIIVAMCAFGLLLQSLSGIIETK